MSEDDSKAAPSNGAGDDAAAKAEATPPPDAPLTPEARLAKLEAEKEDIRNRMLRIAADFDNWKKRSRKEQNEAEGKAREGVLREMLEVVDNLERATGAFGEAADSASILKGVNLVLRLFQSKLERYAVRPFDSKGEAFDPRLHEAISQVPTNDSPPGSVVGEMQKGYRIGEKLLRPAVVAVAVAPPAAPAPAGPPVTEGPTDPSENAPGEFDEGPKTKAGDDFDEGPKTKAGGDE